MIKLLDCTLRDGAHINKGEFGENSIKEVILGLIEANIQLIEIGFLQDGEYSNQQSFFHDLDEVDFLLNNVEQNNSKLGLMLRTDRCAKNKLRKIDSIDFIRIAFYQSHLEEVKEYSKILKNLGYKVYLNPIAISTYDKDEILSLLRVINTIEPNAVSIVDTFGSLDTNTFKKILGLFAKNLDLKIDLGIHLHENLSLSMSLSNIACETIIDRNLIIDSSIQGMGRVPGNLATELIGSYLNQNYDKKINVGLIADLAQRFIVKFKDINEWGYNPIYMNSAMLNIDRSYPEFFSEKGFLNIDNIKMQKMIKDSEYGNKFNSKYAEEIITRYKS
ncbi:4-hydroxy-2-ketovalerate aldolase [Gammaproteobacteria bacterium]|nr:4-hydroxy-2-ketovalerate aldolase [Gammaproteobacteria bacterium]